MEMTRRMFTLGLTALAAPAVLPSAAFARIPVERAYRHVLANGLEAIAIPDHRVPVVTHMLWYRVGSADEEKGKSGLAHFLEHLMFKGTQRNPAPVFSRAVTAAGGQENAFTSYDYTGYFQRVVADQLPAMMDFEADRMTGLVLTDAVVLPERDVVLEERRQRIDNDPGARLGERMQARLWGEEHPYGIPIIGFEPEIRKLNLDDAMAFYRRHYAPNNAILVIAGDVTPETVFRLAEETYGKADANPTIRDRVRPPAALREARETVRLADPRGAPAEPQPQPGPALLHDSQARRGRGLRTPVAGGRRLAQRPALQDPRQRPRPRGERRLLVRRHGAGRRPLRHPCLAASRRLAGGAGDGPARGRRPGRRRGRERRRAGARPHAAHRRHDLFAGQPGLHGADVWRALSCGGTLTDLQQWVERIRAVTRAQVNGLAPRAFDFSRAISAELIRAERS